MAFIFRQIKSVALHNEVQARQVADRQLDTEGGTARLVGDRAGLLEV